MEFLSSNKDLILNLCILWNAGEIARLAVKSSRAITLCLDRKNGLRIEIKSPQKTQTNEPCPDRPEPESNDRAKG